MRKFESLYHLKRIFMYENFGFDVQISVYESDFSVALVLGWFLIFLKNLKIEVGSYTRVGVLFSFNFAKVSWMSYRYTRVRSFIRKFTVDGWLIQ